MQIIEEQDQRPQARDLQQERAQLAFHPLLRSGFDFREQLHRLCTATGQRHHLRVPGRRNLLHYSGGCRIAAALQQTLERFKQRQIGFRASESFAAPATGDSGSSISGQLGEKVFDQRCLAHARLARNAQQQSAPSKRGCKAGLQFRALFFPSNRVPHNDRCSGWCGRSLKLATATLPCQFSQGPINFDSRRTLSRIFFKHTQDHGFERGGNVGIHA